MTLAANADVDALSAFTARILAIHLRLNAGFIDIYELFFGNVFDFFQICFYLFGILLFVKCTLFSCNLSFRSRFSTEDG